MPGTRIAGLMNKLRIHYLQHVSFEGLGCIEEWANERGHALSLTRLYADAAFPALGEIDWLIVLGGPMGVYDEADYPWLKEEKTFIGEAIRQAKVVVGICLGAQLIAEVLGAKVYPNGQKEIGWFPVQLTATAGEQALFQAFPAEMTVFHWHGDAFDLPPGATLLASSAVCRNQAFRYGHYVLGLQFHLEVTHQSLREMIRHEGHELVKDTFVQPAEEIITYSSFIAQNTEWMKGLLKKLSQETARKIN